MYDIDLQSSEFPVSCPVGYNLLSCGMSGPYSQWGRFEQYRYAKPQTSTACGCYDYYGLTCVAWCTTLPVQGYEIIKVTNTGTFSASCSSGKTALGCHLAPAQRSYWEQYRQYYPDPTGSGCNCYDYGSTECSVTCTSQIRDYEVVSVWSSGTFNVNCGNPTNRVLGCGINPSGSSGPEYYRTVRVISTTACQCVDGYGTTCYAVCGKIW